MKLSALPSAVAWHAYGLVASERGLRTWFKLNDARRFRESRARREMFKSLARVPGAATLPPEVGYVLDPAKDNTLCLGVADLGRQLAKNLSPAKSTSSKDFHINKILPDDPAMVSVMLKFALQPALLSTVTEYLGTIPVLGDMDFFGSRAIGPNVPFSKSQLWHCDATSWPQVKVFVYCDEVREADGPFEMIDATTSTEVRERIGYRYAGRRYRVSDANMEAQTQKLSSILGGAGRCFAIDTVRCFHRGSRIREADRTRLVAVFQYVPVHCSQFVGDFANATPYHAHIKSGMTPLERAVLGAELA